MTEQGGLHHRSAVHPATPTMEDVDIITPRGLAPPTEEVFVVIKCQFHMPTCRVYARNSYVNTLSTNQVP
jgi:hypothetical protein